MKEILLPLALVLLLGGCTRPIVKSGYDFSQVKSVAVSEIKDHKTYFGSGRIIEGSLKHHLMEMGLNLVARSNLSEVMKETALAQTNTGAEPGPPEISPADAVVVCTITQFTDKNVITIPIRVVDHGGTLIRKESPAPPPAEDKEKDKGKKEKTETVKDRKWVTEERHMKGKTTYSKKVIYENSVISLTFQMIDAKSGDIVWSSRANYTALNLSDAVDGAIYIAVKPLKKILGK
jgi:hypothetical protein